MEGQIFKQCGTYNATVGINDCWTFDKEPKGFILTTEDFTVPANTSDVGEYLRQQALTYPNTQVFPVLDGLVNVEPSGGDPRVNSEGFGNQVNNGKNPYQEVFTFTKGGICLYKQLTSFDDMNMRIFWVDVDNNCFGTMNNDGTIKGYLVNFGVQYRRNVGTTPAGILVTLLYSNAFASELRNATSFILYSDILGLREIAINYLGRYGGANVLRVKGEIKCAGTNISSQLYSSLTPPDIYITDVATGGRRTVTAITLLQSEETFILTVSGMTSGNTYTIRFYTGSGSSSSFNQFLSDIRAVVPDNSYVTIQTT